MRIREVGCVRVWMRDDESAFFALMPDHFEPIKAAWMGGKTFYEATDMYGQPLIVKLGNVVAISRATPESVAESQADAAADERDDAIKGIE